MIVVAALGCLFGILGIFTIGFLFVPLAALCALVSLVSGIVNRNFGTAFIAIIAVVLAVVGFAVSPSLWLLTGMAVAQH